MPKVIFHVTGSSLVRDGALSVTNGTPVSSSAVTGYVTVATYAAMVSQAVPSTVVFYKVANDEQSGLTNTLYLRWPDGTVQWVAANTP